MFTFLMVSIQMLLQLFLSYSEDLNVVIAFFHVPMKRSDFDNNFYNKEGEGYFKEHINKYELNN